MDFVTIYNCAFNNNPVIVENHIRDDISGIDIYMGKVVESNITYQVVCAWGSTEEKDWITNFKFFLKKYRKPNYAKDDTKIKVHSGYLNGWEKIRQQVLSLINNQNVIVCGYSMGGGLSSLIAVDIQYNNNPANLICVDFDGAKIWNKAGKLSYEKRVKNSYKFQYGNDIVTKVVPGYYSVGKFVHIGPKHKWWKLSVYDHISVQNKSIMEQLISNVQHYLPRLN